MSQKQRKQAKNEEGKGSEKVPTEQNNFRWAETQWRKRRNLKLCFVFGLILVLVLPIVSFLGVRQGIRWVDTHDIKLLEVSGYPIGVHLHNYVVDPFVNYKFFKNIPKFTYEVKGSCLNMTNAPFDLVILVENLASQADANYRTRMLSSFLTNLLQTLPPISPTGLNLAIIEYATNNSLVLPLNSTATVSELLPRIPSLLTGQIGHRSISHALKHAYTILKAHRLSNSNKLILIIGEGNPIQIPLSDYTSDISKEAIEANQGSGMMRVPKLMMGDWVVKLNWLGVGIRYVNLGRVYNPDEETLETLLGPKWGETSVDAKCALECRWFETHEKDVIDRTAEMVCAAGLEKELKRRTGGGTCLNEESRKWFQ